MSLDALERNPAWYNRQVMQPVAYQSKHSLAKSRVNVEKVESLRLRELVHDVAVEA